MEGKHLVLSTITINSIIGFSNRILQIIYYIKTKKKFINSSIKNTSLVFCIFPTIINTFMILIYILFHNEENLTKKKKIKSFFLYLLSFEFLFPIGVHKSFKTKYSDNADNVIVTMTLNKFDNVDVANIIFSFIFIFWSIWYYFICIKNEDDYDSVIYEYSK